MQGSPDAAFLLDHEGKIVHRNKAAQLMFVTNVHQMSFCSIFSFTKQLSLSWDDLAKTLTSEPQHHDATVIENDGSHLGFRLNLVRLPPELMGDANKDIFACAYVTPAHDHNHENGMLRDGIPSIAEEEGTESKQIRNHMTDVVSASLDPMMVLHENGTIAMANDPAVHLFGYSHSELVGKDIASICPTAREVQNILNFMHAPSVNKQQTTTVTTKSGKELSIELGLSLNQSFAGSNAPVYFAHMKDLTTLEEQREEIEHKDTLCQAMINASFDPMFGIDQRGKIMVVNEAACQAFGYTREEFVDKNISMICNERDAVNHDCHLRRYVRTGEKRVIGLKRQLVARRKDGTEFPIELGVSEVALPNGEKMFCGYVRDRTQEQLDKQMLRRKEALIQDKFFQMEPGDARGAMKREEMTLL
jgi:PAS domain S-box-containing protein